MKKNCFSLLLFVGMLCSCNGNEMTPTITADAIDTKQTSMYQAAMQADTMWIEPPVASSLIKN